MLTLYDEFLDTLTDPEAAIRELRDASVAADVLTFIQPPPDTTPKFSYSMQWDNLAVLEISTYEHWLKKQIHENARNKVRKAERNGVVVRVEAFTDALAQGLVGLFNETAERRGRRYSYYGWDVEKVKRGWATELDRSQWIVAYYGEELIGFIKLIIGRGMARTSGTISKEAHRDKAPMNALFAKAVEVCVSKEVPLLVYGRFAYAGRGEDSLTAFKRNNGFHRVDVPRYYIPLTMRGRVGMLLGLHRSPGQIIPGPAYRWLLKMRSKWRDRKV